MVATIFVRRGMPPRYAAFGLVLHTPFCCPQADGPRTFLTAALLSARKLLEGRCRSGRSGSTLTRNGRVISNLGVSDD